MSQKNEVAALVKNYEDNKLDSFLERIFKKVIYEKLSYCDYESIYNIDNVLLKKMVILKAPQELLIKLLFKEENEKLICDILYSLDGKKIEPQVADILLNESNYKIKNFASKYASIDKLVEKLVEEDIDEGLKRLKKVGISKENVNKLLNSDSCNVRIYALKYASTEQLVNRLVKEDNFIVICEILRRFNGLNEKHANMLIESAEWNVRAYAAKFASLDKLIEVLEKEDNTSVIELIKNILKNCIILTEKQADRLIESKYLDMKLSAIRYSSAKKLLSILEKEDDLNIIDEIANHLCWSAVDAKDIEKLLVATSWKVRVYAAGHASVDLLIKRLHEEKSTEVVNGILKNLKYATMTEEQADELLEIFKYTYSPVGEFAVKYASINKLIEISSDEESFKVIDGIIKRLESSKISEEQAEKLLKANNYDMRKYAVRYASTDKLLEMLKQEENYYVLEEIMKQLGDYKLSEEQANEFIMLNWYCRKYSAKYASISKLLEVSKDEENGEIVEQIIKRLEKSKISEEEAIQILNARHWKVRAFASKYATIENVIEVLKEEKCISVINEVLNRFQELKNNEV